MQTMHVARAARMRLLGDYAEKPEIGGILCVRVVSPCVWRKE